MPTREFMTVAVLVTLNRIIVRVENYETSQWKWNFKSSLRRHDNKIESDATRHQDTFFFRVGMSCWQWNENEKVPRGSWGKKSFQHQSADITMKQMTDPSEIADNGWFFTLVASFLRNTQRVACDSFLVSSWEKFSHLDGMLIWKGHRTDFYDGNYDVIWWTRQWLAQLSWSFLENVWKHP